MQHLLACIKWFAMEESSDKNPIITNGKWSRYQFCLIISRSFASLLFVFLSALCVWLYVECDFVCVCDLSSEQIFIVHYQFDNGENCMVPSSNLTCMWHTHRFKWHCIYGDITSETETDTASDGKGDPAWDKSIDKNEKLNSFSVLWFRLPNALGDGLVRWLKTDNICVMWEWQKATTTTTTPMNAIAQANKSTRRFLKAPKNFGVEFSCRFFVYSCCWPNAWKQTLEHTTAQVLYFPW